MDYVVKPHSVAKTWVWDPQLFPMFLVHSLVGGPEGYTPVCLHIPVDQGHQPSPLSVPDLWVHLWVHTSLVPRRRLSDIRPKPSVSLVHGNVSPDGSPRLMTQDRGQVDGRCRESYTSPVKDARKDDRSRVPSGSRRLL